jgi:hypothetical protein
MDFFKKASQSFGQGGGEADLLKQAEGFISSQGASGQQQTGAPAATETTPAAPPAAGSTPAPGSEGYSEVLGSAQTLYQGLQGKLSGKETNVDDQQLAKAASDVLKAADNAGYVKGTQYEQYFDKAEGYLGNYGQPKETEHAATPTAPTTDAPPAAAPPPAQ